MSDHSQSFLPSRLNAKQNLRPCRTNHLGLSDLYNPIYTILDEHSWNKFFYDGYLAVITHAGWQAKTWPNRQSCPLGKQSKETQAKIREKVHSKFEPLKIAAVLGKDESVDVTARWRVKDSEKM